MQLETVLSHVPFGLIAVVALSSCGGGSGGPSPGPAPSPGAGSFLDSAVEGLAYRSGDLSGTTDAAGRFAYAGGQDVAFTFGDVVLGSASGDAVLTPVDLFAGAQDETHPAVTNLARFLQTLDLDGDPDNGIALPSPASIAGTFVDFHQPIAAFEADPVVAAVLSALGTGPLVSVSDAQDHLRKTLHSDLSGWYTGTFSGSYSGTFELQIDRVGALLGCGVTLGEPGFFGFDGSVASSGGGVFGDTTSGEVFTASIVDGEIQGTWENTLTGDSGTFSGTVEQRALQLDGSTMNAIAGDYAGSLDVSGAILAVSFSVETDGHVTIAAPGFRVVSSIEFADALGGRFRGMFGPGVELMGDLSTAGTLSGTATELHTGVSHPFTATRVVAGS